MILIETAVRRPRICALTAFALASNAVHAQFENSASPTQPDNPFDAAVAHPIFEHFAPRILQGARRATARLPAPDPAQPGVLQSGDLRNWPILYREPALTISGSLTGSLGLFLFRDNAFSVPASVAASTYRQDPGWGEYFLEPGITATWQLAPSSALYGGVAYMATGTRGTDFGGVSNTYHGELEQLYAGLRFKDTAGGLGLDVSYGQQDFVVGRSFLLASGASNGAQRGANYMGPRAAWANAALAKATWKDVTAQAFWLKPNEATSAYTGTRLAGVDVDWANPGPLRLGAMYVYAPDSAIVTRDGLNVYNLRARWHPIVASPQAWMQGEYVWQRKGGVAADGWYASFNYSAKDAAWKPLASLRYAALSGDKPGTAKWEGFDPLYFGGGVPDWYQGKLGSTLFGNTNLDSVAASLTLTPDERNIVQLLYLNFRAGETNAPLAIPSAGAPIPNGGGVPAKALANEVDAIWTYTFNKQVNVNAFVAWAAPGSGYKQLYAAEGGNARDWWAIGTQFNISY